MNQLRAAAGIALLGGLVGGLVEIWALGDVPLPGGVDGVATVAAVALLQSGVGLAAGLGAWLVCRMLRPGATPFGQRIAWVAAGVTALGLPAFLGGLRFAHKKFLPQVGVLGVEGLALSAALALGALLVGGLLTLLLARTTRGGERPLAWLGALGFLGALGIVLGHGAVRGAPASDPRNVLVISLDSLRADVFDEYVEHHAGDELRRFVAGSRRYRDAQTTFTHSLPSHASMLTGLYPPEHGALVLEFGTGSAMRPETVSVAERLGEEGWETAAVVTNAWLGPPYGLEAGFGTFINYGRAVRLGHFDAGLAMRLSATGAALRWVSVNLLSSEGDLHPNSGLLLSWLRGRDPSRPFFAFLHYIEMHPPNDPPASLRERFCKGPLASMGGTELKARVEAGEFGSREMEAVRAQVRCLYLADLVRIDHFLEPVLTALRQDGRLEDTLVILLSDHGENLYEKADSYGKTHVYRASSHVPFLVHAPGQPGAELGELVSLVDVPATIYGFTGVAPPPGIRGRDLLEADRRAADDWVFVQGRDPAHQGVARGVQFGDGNKWIRDGAGRDQWFDVERDPGETYDRLLGRAEDADRLRSRFGEITTGLDEGEVEGLSVDSLDPTVVERLRSLGYIE